MAVSEAMGLRSCLPWLALLVPAIAAPPSTADFQLDPRLEIQLWAAEPDVIDPVAMAFDENGNAYVAECRDYPYGAGPKGEVGSTVRLLRDSDGDGRADRSVLFARDLSYVTSVTPWRGGVLAAAAPDIVYLKDTDGDGRADIREVLVSGFHRGVSDSLVNGLRFGPDNRIHGANGGNGGRLRSPKSGNSLLDLGEADFSFDPDSGWIGRTARTGGGFGLVFDKYGHSFTTYNIDHIQCRHLELGAYLDQPGFPDVPTTGSISDHGEMAQIFPVSPATTRPNHPEQSGHFSAAGGMGHLSAAGWPEDLDGAVFVCDVVGNLVHREVIRRKGAGFVASRATNEITREFLASRDPNFRPVGLEHGPDGALYLLDMQREVIEHPDYIPAKLRARQDIRAGDDRGRIWRIAPKSWGSRPAPPVPPLVDQVLPGLLGHPDQWWRVTAQRLLIERKSTHLRTALLHQLTNRNDSSITTVGRLHSLWTLAGLGQLTADILEPALNAPEPPLREAALREIAADRKLGVRSLNRIRAMTRDPSAGVRFRAALALKGDDTFETGDSLARMLASDGEDPWIRRAVLAALHPNRKTQALGQLLDEPQFIAHSTAAEVISELAVLAAADPSVPSTAFLTLLQDRAGKLPRTVRLALLRGLTRGFVRRESPPVWEARAHATWASFEASADDEELAAFWRLAAAGSDVPHDPARLAQARIRSLDRGLPPATRLQSLELMSMGPDALADLVALLDAREPTEIQSTSVALLRAQTSPELGRKLIEHWRTIGAAVRPRVLSLLLERRPLHADLVNALEAGTITAGELSLDLEQRRRLLRTGDRGIAARAARFFSDEEYSNRRKLVDDWLAKLPVAGDAARGRPIFEQACAQCHRCGTVGTQVGPDLSGVAHRSVEDLLGNILDPNMAINPGFIAFLVETKNGESHVGIPGPESADQVTLQQAGGQKTSIARRDIVRLESSAASLMPEGLEAGRTPQDMRDLIAYIQAAR